MNKLNQTLLLIITVILTISTLFFGILFFINNGKNREEINVTSRTIIERITDQYFIVTKTMVVDQESTINVNQGSSWSNFFWGQTIEAKGLIRIDIGVDLKDIPEKDIQINEADKTVIIKLPDATILDASQFGDIEVKSSKGVLKFLLDNDPNQDHNEALKQLTEDAKTAALSDQKVFDEARTSSIKLIEIIVKDLGYTVQIDD
ncbi:DUF4230 domain-containing protein [Candidatus Dojkabacteria bacterium]|nr:DUF4230 domain-containing protein [Candidatus Dojkabacteria bacterium]